MSGNIYQPVGPRINDAPFFRYLDTNGDGTGTKSVTGNFGASVEDFYIQPAPTEVFYISRMLVGVEDGTINSADVYGGLGDPLSNGILLLKTTAAGTLEQYTDLPVTTNGEWAYLCYDLAVNSGIGNANDVMTVRWTFAKTGGLIRLDGRAGERLVIRVEDNFTGLLEHLFQVQGFTRLEGQD